MRVLYLKSKHSLTLPSPEMEECVKIHSVKKRDLLSCKSSRIFATLDTAS